MSIAIATEADIPALCHLLGYLFAQEAEFEADIEAQQQGLKMIIRSPQVGTILLSRQQGRIVGMVSLLYSVSTALGGRVCMLEDMVVAPEYRRLEDGSHIGTELLEQAVVYARQQGVLRITLLTDDDNIAAQRFYQRQGFHFSTMQAMRKSLV
ncbi:GNAT family N-acetyltransferase [Amphritea opalescens]|uniref:GNAT family N-acetyltransferase n=1 Tax=Amphritea opalescens TaxID=2490544 RepID=A0A430KV64_9GAMM|nr:GNAT family N-acetyltransferase [Amphritea opalescens]RTE67397.1 GNAT family N-acetyltransferase [Amphritea opalescens]